MPVTVLFSMIWQSLGEQADFASLERDGVRYIQALVPLEIALTNAESTAVAGGAAQRKTLISAVDTVAAVDAELGGRLRTEDRWTGLRTKIESLPATGNPATVITAYSGANDLLLALIDKVRNNSKLIRDPDADSYYLGDGAAQELPEGIVAAASYTDLLISTARLSADEQAKALVDINSARSDLVSNARDLTDDVRLAVEGTGSRSLGGALLNKLDRFNRSIDNLVPLMTPLLSGRGRIDVAQVGKGRAEMQEAAADLSSALLAQIDIALIDRESSIDQRRLLAIGALALSVLLALIPFLIGLLSRRDRGTPETPPAGAAPLPPRPAHQAPAHQAPPHPSAPQQPARQPAMQQTASPPAQWPPSRTPAASDPEFARWERFGAPR